ncbi:MAG: BspA family leucine-rich repeat surface protein, partial [Ruminococcus sp.]
DLVIVDSAEYTCIKREYNAFDPVYPRMQTQDSKGTGAQYAINSDYSNLEVCVGTDTNGDDIWAKYSDVFDLSTYWLKSTPQADKYRTYYGDDIELGTPNGATRYWSTDSGKSNIYIKYRVSDIPASTRGWLYITGMVYGNQDRYINPVIDDTLQAYINYHRDAPDYDPSPILMATESGNFWNNYYKKLWLDISKCGYCVDNKLKITLKNVDANAIINAPDLTVRCATPNMQAGYGLQNLTDYGRDWLSSHTVNGNIVPTYDFNVNNARFTFSEIVSVKKVNASTVEIRIDATWDLYPYIYLYFPYANENFTFDMDLSMEWEDGDAEFSEETTTSNIPAVTVNGNDKYAILTFDWSKCDYITQRNIGNMHLEFSQPLNYIVYNKDYTPLNYYFIYSKQYFYPIQIADSVLKTNILDSEKLVHLYFDGISADEIKYQIKDCPSPPSTGETPAPSTPETPIIPDAPVKPVVPEEPEVPEVPEEPEEVEEQNLTLHYIYAGKKYTTVYYDSFSSLTGQPANSVTYTESTNHNVIFKKTDSILYFYPALGENDSPSSSDWMSISYDYIKTHNIHDLYIKGGVVYISDPGPDYLEYEVTLVKDILKNKCKKATAFVVHDMKEFTLSEMVDREKNGLVTDAKLETNGTCKAYLWNEGSVVHFWSDADTVYMPQDCSALFYESTIAGTLDLSRFSFAKVTDASQMFCKTRNLSSISFSQSVNVLNVTSMAEMFFESGIVNADLSGFVTSNNLQYMNSMFFKCPNLTNITFGSEFDTSGVTSFNSLFAESKKLETINIEELETNSVTDMSCAFNECKALQSIDLSTWNFGNVEFANKMFGNCKGLTAINFGDNIDASKVITFKDFFAGSDKIVSVNISKWNISDNANVDGFFKWCSSLQTAYVSQKFYDLYSTASNNEKLNKCIVQ